MDKREVQAILGANLQKLMNEKQLSSQKLAKTCGVSQGTISKILNGNMSMSVPVAITIAEGLGVNLDELLDGVAKAHHERTITSEKPKKRFKIGIVSIDKKRITCVLDHNNQVVGNSLLDGGLDLVETSSSLIELIYESIYAAYPPAKLDHALLRDACLNLVTQSYEFEDTRIKFTQYLKKHFREATILSDWQITYLSIFDGNPGISLIIDKGVSLSYMDEYKLLKIGGWKFPVYDLGGENWLGVATIRHTIEAAEGFVPMSGLAKDVLSRYGGKIEKITEACFKGGRDADVYCTFIEPLLRAYFTKDRFAIRILKQGCQHINNAIERVDAITEKTLNIALNGSLADIYRTLLNSERLLEPTSHEDKASLLATINKSHLLKNGIEV